jgi:uncharacterized protein YdeI (YjbR/CyaY-like superfamily)
MQTTGDGRRSPATAAAERRRRLAGVAGRAPRQQRRRWLCLAKKGTSTPTRLSYDEALEEALCHGWIDGQVRRLDEATYRQRFTPRRPRSAWSKRNVEIVERLTREGRIRAPGEVAVARSKIDGRFENAYAGQASMEVPPDLAEALCAQPAAQAMFDTLSSQNRYAILFRLHSAKRRHACAAHRALRHDARARRDCPPSEPRAGATARLTAGRPRRVVDPRAVLVLMAGKPHAASVSPALPRIRAVPSPARARTAPLPESRPVPGRFGSRVRELLRAMRSSGPTMPATLLLSAIPTTAQG